MTTTVRQIINRLLELPMDMPVTIEGGDHQYYDAGVVQRLVVSNYPGARGWVDAGRQDPDAKYVAVVV